ncbi:MAG: glycosyltransferase family 2 protein [Dysgonomonas sp.]
MEIPLFSIIVPCYNQAQYLSDALQSVLNQTFQDWECIIVNDGSPDNTEDIAIEWCKKDSRFKYLSKENGGLSDARNYGISHSSGKYILPLDADDMIDKRYITEALNVFNRNKNIKIVYCNQVLFGKINKKVEMPIFKFENLFFENQIFCSAIYKKSDYDKTAGYNTNMSGGLEDWDFWFSLIAPQDLVVKLDGYFFYYRIKDVSMLNSISFEKNEKLLLQIFKNHVPLFLEYFNPIRDHIEADYYKKRFSDITNSVEFKIGKTLYIPVKYLKKAFHKFFHKKSMDQ